MKNLFLKLKGAKELKKEAQKNINGGRGFCIDHECPKEGGFCCGGPYYGPPCIAGPTNLYCINGIWSPAC